MMKRFFLLLAMIVIAGVVVSCSSAQPAIDVETIELDLGDVPNGEIAARDVAVRNTGDAILVIEAISTSCGCTTATLEPMQLGPGESGVLHIEFNSGAFTAGFRASYRWLIDEGFADPASPIGNPEGGYADAAVNIGARF